MGWRAVRTWLILTNYNYDCTAHPTICHPERHGAKRSAVEVLHACGQNRGASAPMGSCKESCCLFSFESTGHSIICRKGNLPLPPWAEGSPLMGVGGLYIRSFSVCRKMKIFANVYRTRGRGIGHGGRGRCPFFTLSAGHNITFRAAKSISTQRTPSRVAVPHHLRLGALLSFASKIRIFLKKGEKLQRKFQKHLQSVAF